MSLWRAKQLAEEELLPMRGVVGVSISPNARVRLYVESPEVEVPLEVAGVRVQKVAVGRVEALSLPLAAVGYTSGLEVPKNARVRPVVGGVSIGSTYVTAGTMGCTVRDNATGELLLLSNRHVFDGPVGTPVLQPGCMPPGSKVLTNFGMKPIETFEVGDSVLGLTGFNKVSKTMRRSYKGLLYVFHPHRSFPFKLTEEHKVLVIEDVSVKNGRAKVSDLKKKKPVWKPAKEVSERDWLLIPRVKVEEKPAKDIVLEYKIYYCKKCGRNFIGRENAKIHRCGRCRSRKVEFKKYRRIKIDVNSREFAYLLGLFIADGCAVKRSVELSLNSNERELVKRAVWLWSLVFKRPKVKRYGNVIRVSLNSKELAKWFMDNCYTERGEKKVPDFLLHMRDDYVEEFLEGLWAGDKKDFESIFTTSETLAYQLFLLLNKIGRLPSFSISGGRLRLKNGKVIREKPSFVVGFRKHKRLCEYYPLDDYYAVKIRKIETEEYEGEVFNLETEDNTYAVPCIVHNSYDGGRDPEDRVALVARYVDISPTWANLVDAAVARPVSPEVVSPEVLDVGVVQGVEEPVEGLKVAKSGRSSCFSSGFIIDTNVTVKVDYRSFTATFADQVFVAPPIAIPGDSGSVVVNVGSKRVVGLVFAGSSSITVVNKIQNVCRLLDVSIAPVAVAPATWWIAGLFGAVLLTASMERGF